MEQPPTAANSRWSRQTVIRSHLQPITAHCHQRPAVAHLAFHRQHTPSQSSFTRHHHTPRRRRQRRRPTHPRRHCCQLVVVVVATHAHIRFPLSTVHRSSVSVSLIALSLLCSFTSSHSTLGTISPCPFLGSIRAYNTSHHGRYSSPDLREYLLPYPIYSPSSSRLVQAYPFPFSFFYTLITLSPFRQTYTFRFHATTTPHAHLARSAHLCCFFFPADIPGYLHTHRRNRVPCSWLG